MMQPTIVMPETCVFCIIGVPHPDQQQLDNMTDGDYLSTLTPEQYAAFMSVMNPQMAPQQPPPPPHAYYGDVY